MRLLGIDTSGKYTAAGVMDGERLVCETLCDHGKTQSQMLMPMLENMLESAGVKASDMDVFTVVTGPGSFTGIRIGVCSANAMAQAYGKSVIEVDSLETLYRGVTGEKVCALIDARNDNVYAAYYEGGERVIAPKAAHIDALITLLGPDVLFVGDGALAHADKLIKLPGARIAPAHLCVPRAGTLCAAAAIKARNGETVKEARPFYISKPQAERMLEKNR